jgi:hypothetical protein
LFGKAILSSSGPGQWLAAHVDAILYDTERLKAAYDILVCTDYEQFTLQQQQGPLCVRLEKKLRAARSVNRKLLNPCPSLLPILLPSKPEHAFVLSRPSCISLDCVYISAFTTQCLLASWSGSCRSGTRAPQDSRKSNRNLANQPHTSIIKQVCRNPAVTPSTLSPTVGLSTFLILLYHSHLLHHVSRQRQGRPR